MIQSGPVEKPIVYGPNPSVTPHVYDEDHRYALLVVDTRCDFVYCKTRRDRSVPKIPRTGQSLDTTHGRGVPVFYVNHSHTGRDFEMCWWGEHATTDYNAWGTGT